MRFISFALFFLCFNVNAIVIQCAETRCYPIDKQVLLNEKVRVGGFLSYELAEVCDEMLIKTSIFKLDSGFYAFYFLEYSNDDEAYTIEGVREFVVCFKADDSCLAQLRIEKDFYNSIDDDKMEFVVSSLISARRDSDISSLFKRRYHYFNLVLDSRYRIWFRLINNLSLSQSDLWVLSMSPIFIESESKVIDVFSLFIFEDISTYTISFDINDSSFELLSVGNPIL